MSKAVTVGETVLSAFQDPGFRGGLGVFAQLQWGTQRMHRYIGNDLLGDARLEYGDPFSESKHPLADPSSANTRTTHGAWLASDGIRHWGR